MKLPICRTHAQLTYDAVCDQIDSQKERFAAQDAERRERDQVIYYLQVGGHIKIGWTSQLEKRMRSYAPNTTLLAVHPGSRAEERKLHQRFAVHRSHGNEWYPLVPVVLDHIKRMVAEHGEPPTITFGARPVEVRMPRKKATLQAKYGPSLRS